MKTTTKTLTISLALGLCASPALADEREPNDAAIRNALETELTLESSVDENELDVSVVDGVATLVGTVGSVLAERRAVRVARSVRGVRSVVERVEVAPTVTKSASELVRDVRDALFWDQATDAYELEVEANAAGEVTLEGVVESYPERSLAEKVAGGVAGVTSVDNQIEVRPRDERIDAEIRKDVAARIDTSLMVDATGVDVEVKEGRVILSGLVGSALEKANAQSLAWVAGVDAVDATGLEVEPWAQNDEVRRAKLVPKKDSQVRRAVEAALMHDARVLSFQIDTSVEDGVVSLRGTVDNLKAKRAAAADARNTVGVMAVENRIKIRTEEPIEDEQVAANLRAALKRDPYVSPYDVTVAVNDGVAKLVGKVASHFEKARADDIAARTRGVKDVVNGLEVAQTNEPVAWDPYVDDLQAHGFDWYDYRGGYSYQPDRRIERRIKDELWWSPFVDRDEVRVKVEDGVATLTGTVDSLAERYSATENAYEGGAVKVRNRLRLE